MRCKLICLGFFFILFINTAFLAEGQVNNIRHKYTLAIESSEQAEILLKYLNELKNNDPLILAYKGGAEALMAKHSWNPYSKFSYLKKSQHTLSRAVNLAPLNPEVRFLRFSIQHFVPSFLGMSGEIEEDKKVIISKINDLKNTEIKNAIIKFLLESGRCTSAEMKLLKPEAI